MLAQKTTFQASKSWRLKTLRMTKPGEREKVPSDRCQASGNILRLEEKVERRSGRARGH